jgi:predicted RNase H-like HicB family nuclease
MNDCGEKQMGYTVILEQEPDGEHIALVPALPGCVTQGVTRHYVTANIREAIELYIEDCIAFGDPVPTEAGRSSLSVGRRFRTRPASQPKRQEILAADGRR